MKTLLDADDALLEAEKALAAAGRTLDDVTRLTERVHDKHELLVAALNRENGAQARDAAAAQRTRERAPKPQPKATRSGTAGKQEERTRREKQAPRTHKVAPTARNSGG
ncbi:hypothetical protein ERJ75_000688500 [Trypanosoma vivax]|nr:hypothetical protein ERJ75_000688500 [Trypanosoma vivax]